MLDQGATSEVLHNIVGIIDENITSPFNSNRLTKRAIRAQGEFLQIFGDELVKGWVVPLDYQSKGERIIISPRKNNTNIVFSTWGIKEGVKSSSADACNPVRKYGYSSMLALDIETGLIGTAKNERKDKIAGIVVKDENVGGFQGAQLSVNSGYSGEIQGGTLLRKTQKEIASLEGNAVGKGSLGIKDMFGRCPISGGTDSRNIKQYVYLEQCNVKRVPTPRRLSIRKIL